MFMHVGRHLPGISVPAVIGRLETVQSLRYASTDRVPQAEHVRAAELGFYIARKPVLMDGRIELLQYFHEQAVCANYHRYGNLGERALD